MPAVVFFEQKPIPPILILDNHYYYLRVFNAGNYAFPKMFNYFNMLLTPRAPQFVSIIDWKRSIMTSISFLFRRYCFIYRCIVVGLPVALYIIYGESLIGLPI